MTTTYPELRLTRMSGRLLDCLRNEAQLNPKPPAVIGFRTGTTGQPLAGLNEDECCAGAAFVRLVRTFPTWGTPTPATDSVSCAQPFAAQFELSMWRCAPVGDITEPPVQQAWDDLHLDLVNDRLTMMAAICCLWAQLDARSIMYEDWAPVNVDGGCVGSAIMVSVDLYGRKS